MRLYAVSVSSISKHRAVVATPPRFARRFIYPKTAEATHVRASKFTNSTTFTYTISAGFSSSHFFFFSSGTIHIVDTFMQNLSVPANLSQRPPDACWAAFPQTYSKHVHFRSSLRKSAALLPLFLINLGVWWQNQAPETPRPVINKELPEHCFNKLSGSSPRLKNRKMSLTIHPQYSNHRQACQYNNRISENRQEMT